MPRQASVDNSQTRPSAAAAYDHPNPRSGPRVSELVFKRAQLCSGQDLHRPMQTHTQEHPRHLKNIFYRGSSKGGQTACAV